MPNVSTALSSKIQPEAKMNKSTKLLTLAAVVAMVLFVKSSSASASVRNFDGEVNIGLLVNLHHPVALAKDEEEKEVDSSCGLINIDAVQQVIAAKWAVDVINNQSLPHELKIGIQIHDTCNHEDLTQEHLFDVISRARIDPKESPPIIGVIGVGGSSSLAQTSGALQAFNIPLISASPEHVESLGREDNVLTTAPDMSGQARAVANVAYEMNMKSVALISSSHNVIQTFLAEATAMGIRVPRILELNRLQHDQPQQVESFLRHLPDQVRPAVALIVTSHEAVAIAEHLKHESLGIQPSWLIGSLGLDLKRLSGWRRVFHAGVFVEPHMPELRAFKDYFIRSLQFPENAVEDIIQEFKEEMFGCTHQPGLTDTFLVHCEHIPHHEIEMRFQQDPYVSFVVKAVSALTAAFRLVQLDHCAQDVAVKAACVRQVHDHLHDEIMANLKKLSFSSMMPKGYAELDGTQHHFTSNGRLVANKQQVYLIDRNFGLDQIGWYSEDEGLHLSDSLENFISITELPKSSPLINDEEVRSTFARSVSRDLGETELSEVRIFRSNDLSGLPIFSYESFISRTWALVVVSVAIFGFFVTLWMLLYVFQKICDGTLSGNQFMGLLLLAAVMCLFASVIPWLLPPNENVCAVRHFMHPIVLVICFSILLVKAMQLRSLVTIGLGGTIPATNQTMSLIFMVVVQVVIAIEWYLATKPIGIQITDGYPECGVTKSRFLLLHIYPTVLLLLSFFYGVSVIKVRRNFNEGRWITCATLFIIPIFAAWPMVYYFAPVPFHDPSVAVSVLAVAGILLASIFLPKMLTIAKQSKVKKAMGIDLSRSHSDATVYTGFSDYVNFGGAQKPGLYPIYGFTPAQMVAAKPNKGSSKKKGAGHRAANPGYINPASGAQLTTYSDWTTEYTPSINNGNHIEASMYQNSYNSRSRHMRLPTLNPEDSTGETLVSSSHSSRPKRRRDKSTSTTHTSGPRGDWTLPPRPPTPPPLGRRNQTLPRPRSRSPPPSSSYLVNRQKHSQSPSDGMILTASGLAQHPQPSESNPNYPGYRVSEVFLTH